MRSRFAALLAAVFAATVVAPPEGVVVHRHAGGDHAHLHADLASGAPARHDDRDHGEPHHHGHDHGDHAGVHHRHHDHEPGDHHAGARHPDDHEPGVAPSHAPGGVAHFHTTLLLHQAASPPPPAAAPPRPLARAHQASPPVRIALARPLTRSRAPPGRSL